MRMKLYDYLYSALLLLSGVGLILIVLTTLDYGLAQLLSLLFPFNIFQLSILIALMALVACGFFHVISLINPYKNEQAAQTHPFDDIFYTKPDNTKPPKAKRRRTAYKANT